MVFYTAELTDIKLPGLFSFITTRLVLYVTGQSFQLYLIPCPFQLPKMQVSLNNGKKVSVSAA